MKKGFLLAAMVVAFAGFTMAQTTPKPAQKAPQKKAATAPAKGEEKMKDTAMKPAGHHHHKKHTKSTAPKQ